MKQLKNWSVALRATLLIAVSVTLVGCSKSSPEMKEVEERGKILEQEGKNLELENSLKEKRKTAVTNRYELAEHERGLRKGSPELATASATPAPGAAGSGETFAEFEARKKREKVEADKKALAENPEQPTLKTGDVMPSGGVVGTGVQLAGQRVERGVPATHGGVTRIAGPEGFEMQVLMPNGVTIRYYAKPGSQIRSVEEVRRDPRAIAHASELAAEGFRSDIEKQQRGGRGEGHNYVGAYTGVTRPISYPHLPRPRF